MFDPEEERDIFLAGTEKIGLNGFEGEAYARSRMFQYEALGLLSSHFDADCAEWYEVARKVAHQPIDESALMPTRVKIVEYRQARLGLNKFGQDIEGEMDALTRLFMFTLETWPQRPRMVMPSGIGQTIDEFTGIINEFFGYGHELVELIRKWYQP